MYCSKCGRELKEGEVCSCSGENENNEGDVRHIKLSDTIMSTLNFARDLFQNPAGTLKSYFTLDYGKMGIKLMLFKAVVAFLLVFAIADVMKLRSASLYFTSSKLALSAIGFLVSLFTDLFYAGAIDCSSRLFRYHLRKKACFQVASASVPMNVLLMIISAFAFLFGAENAGAALLKLMVVPATALSLMAVDNIKGADKNKKMWIVLISSVLLFIVMSALTLGAAALLGTSVSIDNYSSPQTENPFGNESLPYYNYK